MEIRKEDFLERAEQTIGDDEERLQEYTKTLDDLSNVLGEENLFEQYHPLQAELGNLAPQAVERVTALVEMIRAFENNGIFQDDILQRLSLPRQYPSARFELEIAYFIQESGESVEFVDPKSEHGKRQPDLLVNGTLPIEIKRLQEPSHMVEQSRFFSDINQAAYQGGAPSKFRRAGRIHRELAEPEKEEFIDRIENAIPRVKAGETVEIRETSLGEVDYEMYLAPHEKEDSLKTWMEKHEVKGPLSGPPQTRNDIIRLKRSILNKVEQLPEQVPGVVLIEVDPWIPVDDRAENLMGIARSLLKDIYEHEKLVSVVLLVRTNSLSADPFDLSIENVRITEFEAQNDIGLRTFVTIHNKYIDDSDSKALIDSIFS